MYSRPGAVCPVASGDKELPEDIIDLDDAFAEPTKDLDDIIDLDDAFAEPTKDLDACVEEISTSEGWDVDIDEQATKPSVSTQSPYSSHFTPGKMRFSCTSDSSQQNMATYEILLKTNLKRHFDLGEEIGAGSFGSVSQAKCRITGKSYAIKTVRSHGAAMMATEGEIQSLCEFDHPYIVKLHNFFREDGACHMVMDLCLGGNLTELVALHVSLTRQFCPSYSSGLESRMALRCLWQMMNGVAFLHHHGFIHRDIKPDNFLVANRCKTADPLLKLGDFGFATRCARGETLTKRVGTRHFMAPEIHTASYNQLADIFSLGVTAFATFTNHFPFARDGDDSIYAANAAAGNFQSIGDAWKQHDSKAKAMIIKMLAASATDRPSAKALLLENPWLKKHAGREGSANPGCCLVS